MAGAMRKMGVYLGLVEDDPMDGRAEDYETYGSTARARSYDDYSTKRDDYKRDDYDRESRRSVSRSDWGRDDDDEAADYYDAPVPASAAPVRRAEESPVRRAALWSESTSTVAVAPKRSSYRITTLHPRTYNEARTIGEHFRDNVPVIMNLSEMDDSDAKRLVDFAAGLSFGLHGSIERVTNKVFLLSPQNVSVTAEDKARIAEGGFFNQS